MKVYFLLVGAFFALGGCARTAKTPEKDWERYYSDRSPSSATQHGCIAKVGPDCRARILWRCPSGFVDGCNTPGSTGKHQCVTRDSDTPCALRVEMLCPGGFEDGCGNGSSKNHECVAAAEGSPCSNHEALLCPEGFQDACDVSAKP